MAEGVGGRFLGGAGGGDHYFLAEAGPVGVDGSAGSVSSFSQLLFGNDDEVALGLDVGHQIGQQQHTSSIAASAFPNYQAACIGDKPPEMLSFGGDYNQQHGSASAMFIVQEATKCAPQKLSSGVTCSDSSSASSGNNNNYNTSSNGANANININNNNNNNNLLHASINGSATSKSNKKRNALIIKEESTLGVQCTSPAAVTPEAGERTGKKTRTRNPSTHSKGQRVKLGDRIAALQQLVSPYGKTDTASVLHEAIGYVKFLHDQVQVLCSPYLQSPLPDGLGNGGEAGGGASRRNLRSRGLCLVPVDFTAHVANANGADYWSSANLGNECNQYPGNSV